MEQNQKKDTGMESLFGDWMKSATDFWGDMSKFQPESFGFFYNPDASQKGAGYKAQQAWKSGNKIFQAVASMLSEPENLDALFRGTDTLPEVMMNVSQQVWDSYFELQKRFTDRASRIGKQTKAYSFDDIDQDFFKTIRDIYEKEFRKYLNVPQIGLTRFYQERMNNMLDKFNLFQTSLGEFIYIFYVPIEKSFIVLQEELEKQAEQGEIHDNMKEYYNTWVKILEGHYMKLLQSPEYLETMNNTISALIEYKKARDEYMYDLLQKLPIPTNKDMDELYKEFHQMKRQIRKMSKRIEELESREG